ncbi:MAG: hypothetical protein WA936_11130, partial [Erythrobacter sp.]|uniref:hypothetical protein n=1 Tax=Erythrobacter sp. TaxID=1042 RepID=UPI003C7802B1
MRLIDPEPGDDAARAVQVETPEPEPEPRLTTAELLALMPTSFDAPAIAAPLSAHQAQATTIVDPEAIGAKVAEDLAREAEERARIEAEKAEAEAREKAKREAEEKA